MHVSRSQKVSSNLISILWIFPIFLLISPWSSWRLKGILSVKCFFKQCKSYLPRFRRLELMQNIGTKPQNPNLLIELFRSQMFPLTFSKLILVKQHLNSGNVFRSFYALRDKYNTLVKSTLVTSHQLCTKTNAHAQNHRQCA